MTSKTYRVKKVGGDYAQVIADGLTMKEAHGKLMELFNELTGNDCANWGAAVRMTSQRVDKAVKTLKNGTRMFSDDGYAYVAEPGEPRGYLYDRNGNLYAVEESI